MTPPEQIDKEIEALVREHGGRLKGYLRQLGLPRDLADDAITDALLAVADKRRREEALPNPRGFIFTVARNAAVDLMRKLYASETPDSETVDTVQAPDMLDAVETSEDLRRALGHLPSRQRRMLELRYLGDFSVRETSQILGVAEGTVGPATAAAKRSLKRILSEQNGHGEEDNT